MTGKRETSDFAQEVLSRVKRGRGFTPQVTYDPDGDCIEFIAKPDSFYAERVDQLLTVYYSRETREVIGSLIKGVSKLLARIKSNYPNFRIEIQDGKVRLEHLFTAQLWIYEGEPPKEAVLTYKKLRQVAEEAQAEAELAGLLA